MEGISDYLGSGKNTPAREISDVESIEKAVGKPEDILGPIPSIEELRVDLKNLEASIEQEKNKAEAVAKTRTE